MSAAPGLSDLVSSHIIYQNAAHGDSWHTADVHSKIRLVPSKNTGFRLTGDFYARPRYWDAAKADLDMRGWRPTQFILEEEDVKIHGPFPIGSFFGSGLTLTPELLYFAGTNTNGTKPFLYDSGDDDAYSDRYIDTLCYTSTLSIYEGTWKDYFAVFVIYDTLEFGPHAHIERGVVASLIRAVGRKSTSRDDDAMAEDGINEGDKVEARLGGRSKWYTGKIGKVNSNDTYDVIYEPYAGKIGFAYYLNMKAKTTHTVACLGFFVDDKSSESIVQELFDTLEQNGPAKSSRTFRPSHRYTTAAHRDALATFAQNQGAGVRHES